MKRKLINFFIIGIGIFLLFNLWRSITSISKKGKIIGDTQQRLVAEQEKNSQLKRELAKIESEQYIEKEAREKLNLGRTGEYVVILPPITPIQAQSDVGKLSNLEKWIYVFVNKPEGR